MRRLHNLLLLAATLLCSLVAAAPIDSENDIATILKLFPGYHVLTVNERDAETRAFIMENLPKKNPSVIHTDIDGDGHSDYALLLRKDKSPNAKFVVLLCPEDASCKKVYELDLTGSSEIAYLKAAPPGSQVSETDAVDSHDHPASVKLHASGIELSYYGKASVVYYWDPRSKKIVELQTED